MLIIDIPVRPLTDCRPGFSPRRIGSLDTGAAKAIRGEVDLTSGPDDAVANMRVIDSIYEKAGLKPRGT
jgi:hypothetical protein